MDPKDYYRILGVSHNASQSQINHAYRELAKKWHPDINHSPGAGKKFEQINQAYSVLGNKKRRQMYDLSSSSSDNTSFDHFNNGFKSFTDIFNDFFRGGPRRQNRNRNSPHKGRDLASNMTISFSDAVFGGKTTTEYNRDIICPNCKGTGAEGKKGTTACPTCHGSGMVESVSNTPLGRMTSQRTCPTCHGSGKIIKNKCHVCKGKGFIKQDHKIAVDIPAGITNHERMRLSGQGEPGVNGGPYGDLYIIFHISNSKYFKINGNNLIFHKNISINKATLGGIVHVRTLDRTHHNENGSVKLKVPAGTQSGSVFTLNGLGMPIDKNKYGDERIIIHVNTPSHLNHKQKQAMLMFAKASGKKVTSVFGKMKHMFNK